MDKVFKSIFHEEVIPVNEKDSAKAAKGAVERAISKDRKELIDKGLENAKKNSEKMNQYTSNGDHDNAKKYAQAKDDALEDHKAGQERLKKNYENESFLPEIELI